VNVDSRISKTGTSLLTMVVVGRHIDGSWLVNAAVVTLMVAMQYMHKSSYMATTQLAAAESVVFGVVQAHAVHCCIAVAGV
jgi:hypothetical protein